MALEGAFGDLRKLSEWLATSPPPSGRIDRLVHKLGAIAVPLLGRALRGSDPARRDVARDALASLARTPIRARVIEALRSIAVETGDPVDGTIDDAKVCALGLLAELGEHATARFADPSAMQRRSALALAAQLDSPADIASAADLMIRQLDEADLVQMLEVLVDVAPPAAQRLAAELGARLDLAAERRDRIAALVEALPPPAAAARRPARPPQVAVLVDAAARLVVVASRKVSGERRWRRWAVLIAASGRIDDCLHEDDSEPMDSSPLITSLTADGYRIASTALDHARTVVATAARLTAHDPDRLPSAYYLGRDLLEVGDAHLAARDRRDRRDPGSEVGRAIELLAEHDPARARALLERCPADHLDVPGALAACLLAQGDVLGAIDQLHRALAGEPEWPLHHWNLAIALQRLDDAAGCYQALRRFVATSAQPSALYGDPDQPARVACAERMLAELERAAKLTGRSLGRRRRHPGR